MSQEGQAAKKQTAAPRELWTAKELAAYLKIHVNTLDRMCAVGDVPRECLRVNNRRRWDADEIRAWVEAARERGGNLPTAREWEAIKSMRLRR